MIIYDYNHREREREGYIYIDSPVIKRDNGKSLIDIFPYKTSISFGEVPASHDQWLHLRWVRHLQQPWEQS